MHSFLFIIAVLAVLAVAANAAEFNGKYICGQGNTEYLELLDTSLRMFDEDPELPNISMLYTPDWNGLYEGASWDAWWIQNSYGPSFAAIPFLKEPYITFLENANDLWFQYIGDGKRIGGNNVVGPEGCLCDCTRPGLVHYKQGDGDVARHDYAVEFTGAGIIIQGELLLVRRDRNLIRKYLPLLERNEAFLNERRDPDTDMFLVGFAGNLLGPSWSGTIYPDGRLDNGYLAGMSVTYIAALDRLIELEKLAGKLEKVQLYEKRRYRVRQALKRFLTDEGYFVKGIDLLGVKHGVFGADRHGYFESSVNHDAVAHEVVDLEHSKKIIDKMASIPGLRPHSLIVANYPSLDDMLDGDYGFGNWVNGGHWSTCEARMILAYYRVSRYDDIRNSMRQIMKFFNDYRIDNPLTDFGGDVWFKDRITTIIYDGFGVPAAMVRGLFQPAYFADRMTLTPSIPSDIYSLKQAVPLRFGSKRIYITVKRQGKSASVTLNGKDWNRFDGATITLPYGEIPDRCEIEITLPGNTPAGKPAAAKRTAEAATVNTQDRFEESSRMLEEIRETFRSLKAPEYEMAFVDSVLGAISAYRMRIADDKAGKYNAVLPERRRQIIQLYEKAAADLLKGLDNWLRSLEGSGDPKKAKLGKEYISRRDKSKA